MEINLILLYPRIIAVPYQGTLNLSENDHREPSPMINFSLEERPREQRSPDRGFAQILFDFELILIDLDKIGCTSAIQASLIALGLHYLSRSKSDSKNKYAEGVRPNFGAKRD